MENIDHTLNESQHTKLILEKKLLLPLLLGFKLTTFCRSQVQRSYQQAILAVNRCPFHHHVTTVARKRPLSFCQKCRWQVTPKYAYTLNLMKSE